MPQSSKQANYTRYMWYNIVCTCFFIGRMPFGQGTFGALAAYPLYAAITKINLYWISGNYILYAIILAITIVAYFAIRKFQLTFQVIDHPSIVVDELIGQLLIVAISAKWIILNSVVISIFHDIIHLKIADIDIAFWISFLLFRLLDIKKPLYIGYIDRKMQNAFGVILDDVAAALIGSGIIYICYVCCM